MKLEQNMFAPFLFPATVLNRASSLEHMGQYRFTNPWIRKARVRAGLNNSRISISEDFTRNELANKLRSRMKNRFCQFTSTAQVRTMWKKSFQKEPTKSNLIDFKTEFGFETVWNSVLKKLDLWKLKLKLGRFGLLRNPRVLEHAEI